MGILTGIILYPSISETKRHKYIVWTCRVVAFALAVLAFVLTTRNFCECFSANLLIRGADATQSRTTR